MPYDNENMIIILRYVADSVRTDISIGSLIDTVPYRVNRYQEIMTIERWNRHN